MRKIVIMTLNQTYGKNNNEKNNRGPANVGELFHRRTNGEMDWAMAEDQETWRDMALTHGTPGVTSLAHLQLFSL